MKDLFVISRNTSDDTVYKLPPKRHVIQDFRLALLNTSSDILPTSDFSNCINELTHNVFTTDTFTDVDQCVDFLTDLVDDKVLMIIFGPLCSLIVPLIHDILSINTILVFSNDNFHDQKWIKEWPKVWGDFTEISSFRDSLKQAIHKCEHNTIPISFVSIDDICNKNLNELDQSFMYTKILTEILLETEYSEQSIQDFCAFCNNSFSDNNSTLIKIRKFEKDYHLNSPIWWYTSESFLYSTLNRALRTQEVQKLIKMAFFIRDLHQQIKKIHLTQFIDKHQSFTVYRGQQLSKADSEKLMTSKGGLISFNNFLSTSENRDVAYMLAESCSSNPNSVGVLFEIMIDSSMSTVPFAHIQEYSNFEEEAEVLLSMHSVFRITEINMAHDTNNLWIVQLQITSDDDSLLRSLTTRIRDETKGSTGWHRLAQLLMHLGQLDQAEQIYRTILDECTYHEEDRALTFNELGRIKESLGDYIQATEFYDQAYQLLKTVLPKYHPKLIRCMNNFGTVSMNMGDYSIALQFFETVLYFQKHILPSDHEDLIDTYANIANVYSLLNDNMKALSAYTKSLQIATNTLPPIHPTLASLYNCIGSVYNAMSEYTKALLSYKKVLEIQQKSLPTDHPKLAASYNSIGCLYFNMGEYSEALSCLENSLKILQKSFPLDNPNVATCYANISVVYKSMGANWKALEFYEKARELYQNLLPEDHPEIAQLYDAIGSLHTEMGNDSKAFSAFEKALEIYQKRLPPNHLNIASLYNNYGNLYKSKGEYTKALSFCLKGLTISQEILPSCHPVLLIAYHNIGKLYQLMGEYSRALIFYQKALEIEAALTPNHPDLANLYSSTAEVYFETQEYPKALLFFEKALTIRQKALPSNHLHLAESYHNVGKVYKAMGDPIKALPFLKHFVEMFRN